MIPARKRRPQKRRPRTSWGALLCKSMPRKASGAGVRRMSAPLSLPLERFRARLGDGLILFPHAAADADRAHHLISALQRNASRENHDPPVIRSVNSKELVARLTQFRQLLR